MLLNGRSRLRLPQRSWENGGRKVVELATPYGPSAQHMMIGGRQIGPVRVISTTLDDAVSRITVAVVRHEPGVWGFCNAHTVNVSRTDSKFAEALQHATLFNDGVGLDLASRLLYGAPFPQNLNGTDLTPAVLASLPAGSAVFLLGSAPGVAEAAGTALAKAHPGIRIVGTHHGFFARTDEPAIVAAIKASSAQLVLVGMGNPAQELWAVRNFSDLPAPIMCVGAFLDFTAGRVRRAPPLVRRLRLEWLYRLALEPRRLAKRYLVGNLTFLIAILRQRMRR